MAEKLKVGDRVHVRKPRHGLYNRKGTITKVGYIWATVKYGAKVPEGFAGAKKSWDIRINDLVKA